ncbi:MAG: hypothetical protein IH948_08050 [Bacteroidetes bacterium]|nr:hypothetical protein [Bacteroidota bacterium]
MPTRAIYTYQQIQRDLNAKLHGRRKNLVTTGDTVAGDSNLERDLVNSAVRIAMSDVDFRGNIRESVLTPNLADNQWDYDLPNDVKGDQIIDFRPQNTDSRGVHETYDLVNPEEFDRRKQVESGIYTILNDDLTRTLRVSADVEDQTLSLDELEDTDWNIFSANSVNDSDIKIDRDDFTAGSGSIRFQTDTTDTTDSTIGIQKTSISTFDISNFKAHGSVFVDAKLTTFDTGIHSLSVRLGTDSDNYYQITDSTQNDCSAFVSGWNKVRMDLSNRTTTGSPTDTDMTYAALYWNRDTTDTAGLHLEDTDWHFDNFFIKRGKYYNISYYSRFVWQDTDLTLTENSTHDSHALLVQNDEYQIILNKVSELASGFLRDREDQAYYAGEYEKLKGIYLQQNPSQRGVMTTNYHSFASLDAEPSDSRDS